MRKALYSFFLLWIASVLLISCGGGASGTGAASGVSGTSSETGSLVGGGAGLLPIPEDIFDLPNTLPNSFALSSCPTVPGKPVLRDLSIQFSAGNSTAWHAGTFQGAGAIYVTRNSTQPITLALDIRSLGNQTYPASSLTHDAVFDRLVVGRIYDGNGQPLANPPTVFGASIPVNSFVQNAGPGFQTLITAFVPGTTTNQTNVGLPANGFEGNLSVGVYTIAARFMTTTHTICTEEAMVLVVE